MSKKFSMLTIALVVILGLAVVGCGKKEKLVEKTTTKVSEEKTELKQELDELVEEVEEVEEVTEEVIEEATEIVEEVTERLEEVTEVDLSEEDITEAEDFE